ncbi:A24 family peptidase [Zhihengliuella sp.]|uniref:A24 family peptidase n=1 Tax=Zhihengliuella sp. TaxID=1954483 RepID=UPI002812861F|nr:A24 family peptidase [Zhihengliuella sp.]
MISLFAELSGERPWAAAALAAALVVFAVNGTRLAVIDARTHRLPNRIVLPWYPVAVVLLGAAALLAGDPGQTLRMLAGGAILFGFYLLLHLIQPRGMGMGDVKLAGVLGLHLAFPAWEYLALGTLLTFLAGGLTAVVLVLTKRIDAKASVPFGPFMVLGTAGALLIG